MSADVLVIEDDPVVARAAALVCEAEGLAADIVERADPGLELMRVRRYRLVLCDIMMSDRDGFAVLAEVRARGVETPVVMMTGYATVEYAVRALAAGAMDFVPKPFTVDELGSVVRRGLRWTAEGPGAVPCPPRRLRLGSMSWADTEGQDAAGVGAFDRFLRSLGGVRKVELVAPGAEVAQGLPCAVLTSADGSEHRLLSPLSGIVAQANEAAAADPSLLEKDPYFQGWLYRVAPSDLAFESARLVPCSSDRL